MTDYYSEHARTLVERYRATTTEQVHASWLDLVEAQSGLMGDIGAGAGRDSDWFAAKGWDVFAVEPNSAFQQQARTVTDPRVQWMSDSLPDLKKLRTLDVRFDLLLLSAVWMHIRPADRVRAFRILANLLHPRGLLVISFRAFAEEEGRSRGFHECSIEELEALGREQGLECVRVSRTGDKLERPDLNWSTVVFRLPDDGTGSFPVLRHVIINDDKSSTYKLGLLRALVRIADDLPGVVVNRTSSHVEIPFGVVGLYWIYLYSRLVLNDSPLIQTPGKNPATRRGYGWAKEPFYELAHVTPGDIRFGATLHGDLARHLCRAIGDACANIKAMPVRYITYPGSSRQIFEASRRTVRASESFTISRESLDRFGRFSIPLDVWQCISGFACWLEPAIVNEWIELMRGWQVRYDSNVFHDRMRWTGDPDRTTVRVRSRVKEMLSRGDAVNCIWSGVRLREKNLHVDHCLPWKYWPNNDLWNLVPTTASLNLQKSDRLPSTSQLVASRTELLDWWGRAYNEQDEREFRIQAESSLPLLDGHDFSLEEIFEALCSQKARLRRNQQVPEWSNDGD